MVDKKCLMAALCFLVSNSLFITHGLVVMKQRKAHQHHPNTKDETYKHNYDDQKGYTAKPVGWSFNSWKELDPEYIQERWAVREESRWLMMTAALFGAVAWFWLMVPIVQSAWVLSRGGKRRVGIHMLMAALAVCGGIVELLARLLTVGMDSVAFWMARDFNLSDWNGEGSDDGTGWRVLEMIHTVAKGMILWVDAFESLALFGIVAILFHSVATEPKFRVRRNTSILINSESETQELTASESIAASSEAEDGGEAAPSSPPPAAFEGGASRTPIKPTFSRCFIWLGLVVGLLSLVAFVADVLRFLQWKVFGQMAMAADALLGVVFLPMWLIHMGCQLPEATERYERTERRAAILAMGGQDETVPLKETEGEFS